MSPRLHRRSASLALNASFSSDGDVDLHIRMVGHVGVRDRLEVRLARIVDRDVPPVDVDGRRGGARLGAGGSRGWGGCRRVQRRMGAAAPMTLRHSNRPPMSEPGPHDGQGSPACVHDSTSSCRSVGLIAQGPVGCRPDVGPGCGTPPLTASSVESFETHCDWFRHGTIRSPRRGRQDRFRNRSCHVEPPRCEMVQTALRKFR